jgi:hypothetical protein
LALGSRHRAQTRIRSVAGRLSGGEVFEKLEKAEANAREQTELDRIAAMRFNAGGAPA